ncbi:DUF7535 family protein [Halorientalis pallida]|uniref:Uncharacterized protein n=1 Tax=Halorientalis pallida TaxID=2479928 RepID=A0A498KZT5_9EURY|nr:hypothetical protein [Halorientalis pallida]RXK46451.1 hypothetical protein EAF64_19385 [Halorientalis pallida]
MSEREADSPLPEPLRTVTPPYGGRPDLEMDVIGWGIFLVMAVVVLPLLPFVLLLWLAAKVVGFVARQMR